MARKKGKSPKTPTSSSSKKPPSAKKRSEGSSSMEFSLSDEEALEDIESLTPKKDVELLQSIDLLRQRVQSKIPVEQDSENAEPWVPVVTRSKAQRRQGENKGVVIKDLASKANG
ncbi:hypothetical protein RIF29_20724 [Crotalaria pallida]|uniref:Uncharacterized protein n=1 Tax=Crotalaria pallida TaxID=3830 RepID=A0AAN9F421_CROPI